LFYYTGVALDVAHFRTFASLMQYMIFQTSSLLPLKMSLSDKAIECVLLVISRGDSWNQTQ